MNEEKIRHLFGVLFVFLPYLGQEISPFLWYDGRPLVSILKFIVRVDVVLLQMASWKVTDSPTRLTEFAPLSSDAKPSGSFLSRLFKRKGSSQGQLPILS